jgi:hypothetical protein
MPKWRFQRCAKCGEKLLRIPVKGQPSILPSRCRCGASTSDAKWVVE